MRNAVVAKVSPLPIFQILIIACVLYASNAYEFLCTAVINTSSFLFGYFAAGYNPRLIDTVVISASFGSLLTSLIWGAISDKFGRKKTLSVCLLLLTTCFLIRVPINNSEILPVFAFVTSMLNGSSVISKAYVVDILDSSNLPRGLTALSMSTSIVQVLFTVIEVIVFSLSIRLTSVWSSLTLAFVSSCLLILAYIFTSETLVGKSSRGEREKRRELHNVACTDKGKLELIAKNVKEAHEVKKSRDVNINEWKATTVAEIADPHLSAPPVLASRNESSNLDSYNNSFDIEEENNDCTPLLGEFQESADKTSCITIDAPCGIAGGIACKLAIDISTANDKTKALKPPNSPPRSGLSGLRRKSSLSNLNGCPSSPVIKRNVSFSGLVTVKVIGSDNLAVGKLKILENDEELPVLNSAGDIFPSAALGPAPASSSVLEEEGADLALPSVPGIESESDVNAKQDFDDDNYFNDDEIQPLFSLTGEDEYEESEPNSVQTNISSPSESEPQLIFENANDYMSYVLRTNDWVRHHGIYSNGAKFYENQLASATATTVFLKVTRTLFLRKPVVLSNVLYASVSALFAGISVSFPRYLLELSNEVAQSILQNDEEGDSTEIVVKSLPLVAFTVEDVKFIYIFSYICSLFLIWQFFERYVLTQRVIGAYKFGVSLLSVGVPMISIFPYALKNIAVPSVVWLLVLGVSTCVCFGSMWLMLCCQLMISNSGYRWERGTVFGLAEMFGSFGKIVGVWLIGGILYKFCQNSLATEEWPFNTSFYWIILGFLIFLTRFCAESLPRSVMRKKREPNVARYALSITDGASDEWKNATLGGKDDEMKHRREAPQNGGDSDGSSSENNFE